MVLDPDGNALDVGRKTRAIPPSMRRALSARDRGCRFPGCTNRRFVDGHHIQHWADGGETKLQNLVLLCRTHHRLVHEEGFGLALEDNRLVFRKPDGTRLPNLPQPLKLSSDCVEQLENDHRQLGLDIDADTVVPHWRGERAEYSLLVAALQRRRTPIAEAKM